MVVSRPNYRLDRVALTCRRFDGSMSQAQRATTIEEFGKKTKEPLVLLISLKAGGVGLNLTMANRESPSEAGDSRSILSTAN